MNVLRKGTMPAHPRRVVALDGAVGPLLHRGITPIATTAGGAALTLPAAERARIAKLPVVDKDGLPDLAKIKALKPDLIVGAYAAVDGTSGTTMLDGLAAIAPIVVVEQQDRDESMEVAYEVSKALGDGAWAQATRDAYDQEVQRLITTYAGTLTLERFAALRYLDGKITAFSVHSWPGAMLADLGANVVPAGEESSATELAPKEAGRLIGATVALVYRDGSEVDPELEAMSKLPSFAELPVAKAHTVFPWSGFFADRYDTGLAALKDLEGILRRL